MKVKPQDTGCLLYWSCRYSGSIIIFTKYHMEFTASGYPFGIVRHCNADIEFKIKNDY